ncbi:hypothetical protein [Nostoc sp. FACHB-857]|uniref:Uncharacterized protein n=1 Tax=Nostoc paludosum FACHB-159 TaxID=2692908 RepID=A0ABR8KJI1_9NOSO|nr:hypothetical protein [Nostoc sp. FACHB-857]MBD2738222.1 hypothetical protein [Nostoc paludosum FACHB-159]
MRHILDSLSSVSAISRLAGEGMRRWGDGGAGEQRGRGAGEQRGRGAEEQGRRVFPAPFPLPPCFFPCPMPNAQCPMPNAH